MATNTKSFFDTMITKEEWDNPDLIKFFNVEVPACDIPLREDAIDKVIASLRSRHEPPATKK